MSDQDDRPVDDSAARAEEAPAAAMFGVRHGRRADWRLNFPGLDGRYYVKLVPPAIDDRARLTGTGMVFDRNRPSEVRVDAWAPILERLHAQVTDFCLPQYDEETDEQMTDARYSPAGRGRNDKNEKAYRGFNEATLDVVIGACLEVSGEDPSEAGLALYVQLRKEHGPLLRPWRETDQ